MKKKCNLVLVVMLGQVFHQEIVNMRKMKFELLMAESLAWLIGLFSIR